jgi:hypothetical protein
MSDDVVLIVESDDAERFRVRNAFHDMMVDVYECRGAVEAMGVLGKQNFVAIVMAEGKRQLSLRGMCQLALRKHPELKLFLRGRPGSGPALREKLGVDIQVLPSTLPAEDVAESVMRTVDGDSFDEGSFGEFEFDVALDLGDDLDLDVSVDFDEPTERNPIVARKADEATERNPVAPGIDDTIRQPAAPGIDDTIRLPAAPGIVAELIDEPPPTTPALDLGPAPPEPLFVGRLEPGASTVLLMGVYAQELTGRLEISAGDAKGALFIYEGNPVAIKHPEGDEGIRAKLIARKLIPEDLPLKPPPGELLAALVERGDLTGDAMHEFLRGLVRDRVLALILQDDGAYRFFEDEDFVHTTPLLKVNAFGLMFEARRRSMPPQEVLRMAGDLTDYVLMPQPALADAARKLKPFVRDQDLNALLARPRTVGDLLREAGLDEMMGTLLVLTLDDAHLVKITDEEPEDKGLAPLDGPDAGRLDRSMPEAGPVDDGDDEEAALRSEINTLYMRLKPLKNPAQVLGVQQGATVEELEARYKEMLGTLDPARVPEGEHKALIISRMDELRKKLGMAFELLRFEAP